MQEMDGLGRGEAAAVPDPADFRYVDEKYEPLAAADLRNAAQNADESKLALAIAKRMPIRLRLFMDQRRIDDLLIACGNSPLVVEVRQIRFNPDAKFDMSGGRSGNSMGDGPGLGGMVMPGMGMGFGGDVPMGGGGMHRRGGHNRNEGGETYDTEIELYGIIYIFNPVDEKLLGYTEPVAH